MRGLQITGVLQKKKGLLPERKTGEAPGDPPEVAAPVGGRDPLVQVGLFLER